MRAVASRGDRSSRDGATCEVSATDNGTCGSMPICAEMGKAAGMVILTVDDSDIILNILEFTLTSAGFDVARASDGIEAIEWLENNRADIVTTDINMPRLNGLGLIEKLGIRDDLGYPTIIVISSERDEASVQRAMTAGASDWFVKPFDPQQLIAKLTKVRPSGADLRSVGV